MFLRQSGLWGCTVGFAVSLVFFPEGLYFRHCCGASYSLLAFSSDIRVWKIFY